MTADKTGVIRKAVDGLVNIVSGLGTAKSKRENDKWCYDLFNDWQQLDACYQSNWIARKIVDVRAEDMTREWRQIKCQHAEEIAAVEQELCAQIHFQDAEAWARLYGGSAILMLTGQDLSKPLNINRIKKGDLERLVTFDRHELGGTTINMTNILADNYLQPETFTIQGGGQPIHWTHFVRFFGERLPRRQMVQTQGWGDSVLRKCLSDIEDFVAATGGIAELMREANIDVITREGLNDDLASDQDDAIQERYALFSQMKSIVNLALLDGTESFDRRTLALSGVAPIIEQFMTWISGAADTPLTRLFGTSAKGLNATGEGDERIYYDSIRAEQVKKFTKPLRHFDEVLVRSATGSFSDDFDYAWNPLNQPNTLEVAQEELLTAQKNITYLDAAVITKSQIQRELQTSEEYQFDDDKISELEEMEEVNLFEDLPDINGEETVAVEERGDIDDESDNVAE